MSGGIYTAASGAVNQLMQLTVIFNNLANLNTTGFKGERATFRIPDQSEIIPNGNGEIHTNIHLSLVAAGTMTDFSQCRTSGQTL